MHGKLGLELLCLHKIEVLFHVEVATVVFERVVIIEGFLDEATEMLAAEDLRLQRDIFIVPEIEIHTRNTIVVILITVAPSPPLLAFVGAATVSVIL